jgi:hypothetical protein
MSKLPKISELTQLIRHLKRFITNDMIDPDSDSKIPVMTLTIGSDLAGEWSYQTGDNSYTGGAYHYPFWAVTYINRRSNSVELARDIVSQLQEYQSN